MARVFTVNFTYKGKSRAALVSFAGETCGTSFLVRYLDEDIGQVVPEKKLVVSLSEGLKSPKALSRLGQDLLNHTTEAISQYLHVHQS